jgi:hypothetical protein
VHHPITFSEFLEPDAHQTKRSRHCKENWGQCVAGARRGTTVERRVCATGTLAVARGGCTHTQTHTHTLSFCTQLRHHACSGARCELLRRGVGQAVWRWHRAVGSRGRRRAEVAMRPLFFMGAVLEQRVTVASRQWREKYGKREKDIVMRGVGGERAWHTCRSTA